MTFAEREEHLRQRAARGWIEDEDVRVCMAEIDRLRVERLGLVARINRIAKRDRA